MTFECRGCESLDVELFLDLGDQPHCNRLVNDEAANQEEPRYPLRVGFCHNCTLVQIDYTIPKEAMFSDYPYVSGTTRTLVEHFRQTAARLVHTYALSKSDLVVDIGSNDGTWLKQYAPFNIKVLGVEPAANVAALALKNGIPTLVRFFNEETADAIIAQHGQATLITAAGVFFHLEELHSVVRGIKKLLKPDGVFCVQAIYLGGMLENTAFDQIYHEHLCYYTAKSLNHLLQKHGLEAFDGSIVPIHGGSIELHVGHIGSRTKQKSLEDIERQEIARGFDQFDTYVQFAHRVQEMKTRLLAVLNEMSAQGKTVFAYGAPAKGATLLNSFHIDTRLVQKAVEKNPLKFGFLMPGSRIPIVDESTVRSPDVFLLLAWNFLEEILSKEGTFLERGGVFIVPVPQVRVLALQDLPGKVA